MVLPSKTFRNVMDLPTIDWSGVSEAKQAQVIARCHELYQQLPQLTAIEGVKKFEGARWHYERALVATLEALGTTVNEETKAELVLADFLG